MTPFLRRPPLTASTTFPQLLRGGLCHHALHCRIHQLSFQSTLRYDGTGAPKQLQLTPIRPFPSIAYLALNLPFPFVTRTRARTSANSTVIVDSLSISLFLIGITSALYHATLRQTVQFSDDLSMLLINACLLNRLYTHGQSPHVASLVTFLVTVSSGSAAAFYVQTGNILHHVTAFSVMVHFIWPRTLYLIYYGSSRGVERTEEGRKRLMRRFKRAAVALVSAFVIWNIDLEFCMELRSMRERIGLPWAWLLELHGWWHVMTAVGAAEYVALVRELCDG